MNNLKMKRSIMNIFTSLIGTSVSIILGLIIPRFVLVNYGSETNGMINSINQFVLYLSLFEAGIGSTALQALYKPVAENNKNGINEILSSLDSNYKKVGTIYLVVLIMLSFFYPFLIMNDSHELSYFKIFNCVLFSGLGNVILFFFQGKYRILMAAEGKNYILTNLQTIITMFISISKIVLINLGFSITIVIIATFILNLIQVFYIMRLIKYKYKWINLKEKSSKFVLEQKNYVFVQQISWMIFQNVDILLLTIFCGLKIVSVYSMYKLIITNVQNFLNIPLDSCNFAMGQLYSTDRKKYISILDCLELYYSAICFAVEAVVLCLITSFISLYTSGINDINYVDKILPVMFIIIELLIFMRKPMINTITYAGHFRLTTPQTIIEMIINLVISIFGVIKFGIYGVLIGTIIALIYRFFDVVFYANKKILHRNSLKTLFIYLTDVILFIICILIYNHFNIEITSYVKFLKYGILFLIFFIAIYICSILLLFSNERKMIISIVKKTIGTRRES